jgi:hypothetical protein
LPAKVLVWLSLHRPMLQNVKKVLANPEPSTHDPIRTSGGNDFASETRDVCRSSVFQEKLFFKNYKTDGTFRPGANMH